MEGVSRQGAPLRSNAEIIYFLTTTRSILGYLTRNEVNALWFYISKRKKRPEIDIPYPNLLQYLKDDSEMDAWADHMLETVLPLVDVWVENFSMSPIQESMILNYYSPDTMRTDLVRLPEIMANLPEPQHIITPESAVYWRDMVRIAVDSVLENQWTNVGVSYSELTLPICYALKIRGIFAVPKN